MAEIARLRAGGTLSLAEGSLMPVLRHLRHHYSAKAGWPKTRAAILARAEGRCECRGRCGGDHPGGRCDVSDRVWIERSPERPWLWRPVDRDVWTARRVILTVAHLNQQPGDDRPENLEALCQYCHTQYDKGAQWSHRRRRQHEAALAAGQLLLPLPLEAR